MMAKRIISVLIICVFLFSLVACGGVREDGELEIVCTVFPIYDWIKNIVGDTEGVSVRLLVSDGSDLHSYNASAADIIAISTCDVLLMAGGDSDAWVEAALAQAKNGEMRVLRLLHFLEEKGMAYAADGEHHHDEGEECHHALDEHFWLSPKAALVLCEEICGALCEINEENAHKYTQNFAFYKAKVDELDALCAEGARGMDKPFVFADRFAFKYLFEDYGLPYVAAFSSCSADTDASFSTVTGLAEVVKENGLSKIYVSESAVPGIAEAVADAADIEAYEIVSIDSMQSVTARDIDGGASYVEIMRENIEKLFG